MAVIDYAGFITECLSSDGFPVRNDGWLLKHIDTGDQYIHVSGSWQSLGLGLSFAPPTKSGRVITNASGYAIITFGTPFVNDEYTIALTCTDSGGNQPAVALMVSRTSTGFVLRTVRTRTGQNAPTTTVAWLATKNHND